MNRFSLVALALVLPLVAACGQKASTRTTAITPAPVVSGALRSRSADGAGSNAKMAQSPSDLHCGSEPIVWVNEHSKVYHLQGDPYYGHTKSGAYMCELDAVHSGYRAAKK